LENEKSNHQNTLAKLQDLETKVGELAKINKNQESTIESLEDKLDKSLKELKDLEDRRNRDKEYYEKETVNKKQQLLLLQQQQTQLQQQLQTSSPNNQPMSISDLSGSGGMMNPLSSSMGYDKLTAPTTPTSSNNSSKLYSMKKTPSTHDFMSSELFHSSLTHKEGEISALHAQINSLEYSRRKLEDELVKLTTTNEELFSEVKELKAHQQDIRDLQQRYQTSLELLGEKEETVNELRLDIQDMKDLYKNQINDLLSHIESLKKQQQQ